MSSNALAKIDFDKDQLAVIESQFFPAGASKAEQQYCFSVARELGLNPITREIYFVPRRQKIGEKWVNKVEPMVGRDGFLSIAHRTNQMAGIETTCCIKDVPQLENGKWVVKPQLIAECTVWRKDSGKPYTAQVAYNEYCQKSADGSPTKFWSEKPETMLKKVAESQALRKAFNIHGIYCPEELGAGFETEGGEILTPTIEAEFSRADPEPTRLTVVPPPASVHPPSSPVVPVNDPDEPGWPVSSPPPPPSSPVPLPEDVDSVVAEIVGLLEGKSVPYEIDMECGIISAKSYNERQLLKDTGFKWNGDTKSWIYQFQIVPF